jgi:hypothetical protein
MNRNKMGVKISFELGPGTEVRGCLREGFLLAIFGPFASRGTEFEVSERCDDVLILIGVDVTVQEIVGVKEGPKGFGLVSRAVERFRDGA